MHLELSWIERTGYDDPDPSLTFEGLDEATKSSISYSATLQVCATPRCSCHAVWVQCAPRSPKPTATPGLVHSFWLELRERTVQMTPELNEDPKTLRLAQLMTEQMTDAVWEELHRWFWTAKIEAIEAAEIDDIDLTDLPDASDGHMIPFVEVFPCGLSLNFTLEQAVWAADEQYCVQLRCKCTQSVLSFLQVKDAAGQRITSLHEVPALCYDYRSRTSQQLTPGPAGTPPTSQLLEALRTGYPALDTRLALHHRMMQCLYARHELAQPRLRQHALEARLPVRVDKIGRNDPCPCGSGKKFKKCCGA